MESSQDVQLQQQQLDFSASVLRALAHPLRMQILSFIDSHQSINVNRIYTSLGLEQSITSQHLRILRSAGLVKTERDGKFINYRVDYDKVAAASGAVDQFLNQNQQKSSSGKTSKLPQSQSAA